MKILMVNKFLHPAGGAETYTFEVGKGLSDKGHDVAYFGMEHPGRIVGNRLNQYVSEKDFHKGGLKQLLYPLSIIYSAEARRKFTLVMDDLEPDIVHINNFNYQITPSILYAVRDYMKRNGKRIKTVLTAHDYQLLCPNHLFNNPNTYENCEKCTNGNYAHCISGRCIHGSWTRSLLGSIEGALYRTLGTYRMFDDIICPSSFLAGKFEQQPTFKGKCTVIQNFSQPMRKGDYTRGDYVLFFGRVSPEKGVGTLIEAAKRLPHIPFIVAGGGPMVDDLAGIANLKFVGFKRGEDLESLIGQALFTVAPSRWYENCPFSVIESQLLGTPVIGSNIGGMLELIRQGVDGEFFEFGNAQALADTIDSLWRDRDRCARYAAACDRKTFIDIDGYVERVLQVYQKV